MDREESKKTNATAIQGVRFRTLLSIHPARSAGHPRRLRALCGPCVESSVPSAPAASSQYVSRFSIVNSAVRTVLADASFSSVVRTSRNQLMQKIREDVNRQAGGLGIEVVDVRLRRADLPEQNSQAVYQRMQTERQREAQEFRSQGTQRAQEIRARADRDVTVILAEAQSKGEQTRGEGDAERNRIYADAFGRDPDFFAFYRAMQAYENGLRSNDTRMLLKPDSDFFRFFSPPGLVRGKSG